MTDTSGKLLRKDQEEILKKELDLAVSLVLEGRSQVLKLGPGSRTFLLPAFLLAQGWERLLKVTWFLSAAKDGTPPSSAEIKRRGHDLESLRHAYLECWSGAPDSDAKTSAIKVWTEGDWLWEKLHEYARGDRYYGLDQLSRTHELGYQPTGSEIQDVDHPESKWYDYYDAMITDYGLAKEEEIDDLDSLPAYGRV